MHHINRLIAFGLMTTFGLVACDLIRTPEECDSDLDAMQTVVADEVTSALSCSTNSDCVAYDTSNGCFGACPVAINAGELPRIDEEIARADARYCVGFAEQCGYTTPSCPELTPVCQAGQCVMVDDVGGP